MNIETREKAGGHNIAYVRSLPLFSLIRILTLLGKEKRTVLMVTAACSGVALGISLLLQPMYTANSIVLPPKHRTDSGNALANLGALAGVAGSAIGARNSDDMYIRFITSDTVLDALIRQFDLRTRYKAKTMIDARLALKNHLQVTDDKKSGLIDLAGEDKDPVFAAALVNAVIPALRDLLDRIAVTDAQQSLLFLDQQIAQTRDKVSALENQLLDVQARSGIRSIDGQTQEAIQQAATLRGQIVAMQVQIDSLATFATAENHDMKWAQSQLQGLQSKLAEVEGGRRDVTRGTGSNQNANALKNLRTYRELKYQQAILDNLTKQADIARLDEAKEGPLVQQIDRAQAPEKRSWPRRSLIIMIGFVLGFLTGSVYSIARRSGMLAPYSKLFRDLKDSWSFRHKRGSA